MRPSLRHLMRAAATLLLALAAFTQPVRAATRTPVDVTALPGFKAATRSLSAADRLELAGLLNIELRQYEQAVPIFEALVDFERDRADLWFMLAFAYNRVNEPREALDAADIAITLAPEYPEFYSERGMAALRLGRYSAAIKDLRHFVAAFPGNAQARYYLGLAQAAQGDDRAARENLLRAQALDHGFGLPAAYYLGLIELKEGRLDDARGLLDAARSAFEGVDTPAGRRIARQAAQVDRIVHARLRRALDQADADNAPVPLPIDDRK